jgi:hypothetical protein
MLSEPRAQEKNKIFHVAPGIIKHAFRSSIIFDFVRGWFRDVLHYCFCPDCDCKAETEDACCEGKATANATAVTHWTGGGTGDPGVEAGAVFLDAAAGS